MPSSIPYDPSLVLAGAVSMDALDLIYQILAFQAPVDEAQEKQKALLASKRSLETTKAELAELGIIDTQSIDSELETLNNSISESVKNHADLKIKAETQARNLRQQIPALNSQVETPVDYAKTGIKTMPLAADSMNMNVQ
jgi:hypothetical protein